MPLSCWVLSSFFLLMFCTVELQLLISLMSLDVHCLVSLDVQWGWQG